MTEEIAELIEYPQGHVRRREECFDVLLTKFHLNLSDSPLCERAYRLADIMTTGAVLDAMSVNEFLKLFSWD